MIPEQRTRHRILAKYSAFYFPFKPPGIWSDKTCVYCGSLAEERDHIPPLCWLDSLGARYFEERKLYIVWVLACRECNTALGSKRFFTVKDRTQFLIERYEKRYRRLLDSPVWNEQQIEYLSGRVKTSVQNLKVAKNVIRDKLKILRENLSVR